MFTSLLKPKVDVASLVIRWGLAAVFLVHGYFKLVQTSPLVAELNMTEQTVLGPEYNLVIIALFLGVVLLGSGAFSIDGLVLRLLSRSQSEAPAPAVAHTR